MYFLSFAPLRNLSFKQCMRFDYENALNDTLR